MKLKLSLLGLFLTSNLYAVDIQINNASSGGVTVGANNTWTGINSFQDGSKFSILNQADTTKVLQFSVASVTTGNTRTVTIPDSNTTLPIISQIITISGPTTARTWTVPDASFSLARIDAAQSFTGLQTFNTGIAVASAQQLQFNGADYPAIYRNTTQTNPGLAIETKNGTFNGIILTAAANDTFNWAFSNPSTPTLLITGETQNTAHWLSITHNDTDGIISVGLGGLITPQIIKTTTTDFFFYTNTSTHSFRVASTAKYVGVGSDYAYAFTGSAGDANQAADTELNRPVAGVVKVTDGSGSTNGWLAQPAAYGYVTADITNATASLANVTGAVATLKASRNYSFRITLHIDNSTAGDGVQIDFNGGNVTTTNFIAYCESFDASALKITSRVSALSSTCSAATFTGNGAMDIYGTIEVNAAGTFQIRAAEVAHTTGTETVRRGSLLYMTDLSS